jgi:PAT family beta-lactamase induction signal transducer AmpG
VAQRQQSLAARLAILSVFYLVQGLPFGFQAKALPVYLTTHGLTLTEVGFAGAVSLPWLLKPLWAPFVDRYANVRFGRRRSWIVPLQAALASTCLGLAFVPSEALAWFFVLITLTNLFAATMDIAVDGLAVDMLEPAQLGWGNIAQVVGYKIGMLCGGGILLWASQWIGWRGLFEGMSVLIFAALLITLWWREPVFDEAKPAEDAPHTDLRALLRTLGQALVSPGGRALLLVVATYKIGESVSDGMFEPFLVREAKWSESRIGLVVGIHCMWFSLAGSFLGGAFVSRWGAYKVLVGFAVARTLAILGVVVLGGLEPGSISNGDVVLAKGLEELTGGGLTTAMFAFMMGHVDRRIGATHYTLLAGVEVFGKMPGGLLSGVLADAVGFAWTFATGFAISLVCLPLLRLVRPRPVEPPQAVSH